MAPDSNMANTDASGQPRTMTLAEIQAVSKGCVPCFVKRWGGDCDKTDDGGDCANCVYYGNGKVPCNLAPEGYEATLFRQAMSVVNQFGRPDLVQPKAKGVARPRPDGYPVDAPSPNAPLLPDNVLREPCKYLRDPGPKPTATRDKYLAKKNSFALPQRPAVDMPATDSFSPSYAAPYLPAAPSFGQSFANQHGIGEFDPQFSFREETIQNKMAVNRLELQELQKMKEGVQLQQEMTELQHNKRQKLNSSGLPARPSFAASPRRQDRRRTGFTPLPAQPAPKAQFDTPVPFSEQAQFAQATPMTGVQAASLEHREVSPTKAANKRAHEEEKERQILQSRDDEVRQLEKEAAMEEEKEQNILQSRKDEVHQLETQAAMEEEKEQNILQSRKDEVHQLETQAAMEEEKERNMLQQSEAKLAAFEKDEMDVEQSVESDKDELHLRIDRLLIDKCSHDMASLGALDPEERQNILRNVLLDAVQEQYSAEIAADAVEEMLDRTSNIEDLIRPVVEGNIITHVGFMVIAKEDATTTDDTGAEPDFPRARESSVDPALGPYGVTQEELDANQVRGFDNGEEDLDNPDL
ncbi:hypothetical protein CKM354_000935000 [Cercospora kikuchii]|uniref:Uncharacterized protein n=1 Tax=Cercospora kikuchii TaxID=84275 RepID=A0A9P3FK98_9PEZI|nr:uncharacterized protein CKM354_000935000 [Cercospora kikuchii]GIZ46215.1 hypothetical protein CKM354_000935000 [Cercospora kikuchii]